MDGIRINVINETVYDGVMSAESAEMAELLEFLAPYPGHVVDTVFKVRDFLVERFSPTCEIFYDATQTVCAGLTYTGEVKDVFVNTAAYANHVTLIFTAGFKLDDPENRLRGSGSTVRNIRLVQGLATLMDPYILNLVDQASDMAARPSAPSPSRIIVKSMKGPKKRPTQRG